LKVIRWLLSFYIFGYLFYHLTPVFYAVHVNYAPPKPVPLPYQKTCKVVFGVKTAIDGGVGRLSSLEKLLEERDITFSLGHSIDYSPRIKRGNVPEGYGYRDLGGLSLFSYLIFAHVPKLITLFEKGGPLRTFEPKGLQTSPFGPSCAYFHPSGRVPKLLLCLGKAVEPCLSRLR
jgi:hypothetical protein